MKKSVLVLLVLCVVIGNRGYSQSRLLNRVAKSVANDLLGQSDGNKNEPEPDCASDQAELVFDLGGKLQLMYSEVNIYVSEDGSLLLRSQVSGDYFIAKDGVTRGPYKENNPQIATFRHPEDNNQGEEDPRTRYKQYITKSGDKYLITFNGKSYGPYAIINSFVVSKLKQSLLQW